MLSEPRSITSILFQNIEERGQELQDISVLSGQAAWCFGNVSDLLQALVLCLDDTSSDTDIRWKDCTLVKHSYTIGQRQISISLLLLLSPKKMY